MRLVTPSSLLKGEAAQYKFIAFEVSSLFKGSSVKIGSISSGIEKDSKSSSSN